MALIENFQASSLTAQFPDDLCFHLLGEFRASLQGRSVLPSAAKPYQLLALFALRSNEVMSGHLLMEELWGENPPRSAKTTLQTYIFQIRRRLASASAEDGEVVSKLVLATRHGGYILHVNSANVDTNIFERQTMCGVRALGAGRYDEAAQKLAAALSIWEGQPLADVEVGMHSAVELARLNELHRSALEAWLVTELRRGNHLAILGDIVSLRAKDPFNEFFCGVAMNAFYDLGRVAESLSCYREISLLLREELGVQPSASLSALHRAILNGEPSTVRWAQWRQLRQAATR